MTNILERRYFKKNLTLKYRKTSNGKICTNYKGKRFIKWIILRPKTSLYPKLLLKEQRDEPHWDTV